MEPVIRFKMSGSGVEIMLVVSKIIAVYPETHEIMTDNQWITRVHDSDWDRVYKVIKDTFVELAIK